jgi:hypothetical protein
MLKFAKRNNDDAISHDRLRIRITCLTSPNQPNLTTLFNRDIRLNAFNIYMVAVRLFIRYGMDIMPYLATPGSHLLPSYIH